MRPWTSWPVNIVGLGLIIAGVLFAYFLNFVGIIIGLIMVHRRDHGAVDDVPAQEVRGAVASSQPARGNGDAPSNPAAMAVNIIGLGLLVAGIIFLIFGGVVLWILGDDLPDRWSRRPLHDLAAQEGARPRSAARATTAS